MEKKKLKEFIFLVCDQLETGRGVDRNGFEIFTCNQFGKRENLKKFGCELHRLREQYGVYCFEVDHDEENQYWGEHLSMEEKTSVRIIMLLLFLEWYK